MIIQTSSYSFVRHVMLEYAVCIVEEKPVLAG